MNLEIPASIKTWSQFGHPILMWILLGMTVYALYLGMKWRQFRTATPEQRKEMGKQNFREKHYQVGSLLLGFMVMGTVGGMAVTYINNGKLFFGPHLLVGLAMTVMIALATALVPYMQKGNDLARYTHIALNLGILGLFGWQAITGMDIVQRIISKM